MLEEQIKQAALDVGFDLVGIASADDPSLAQAVDRYTQWLGSGYGASMDYLERHKAIKSDPEKFFQNAKSVICVALLYAEERARADAKQAQVSLYTRGADYHEVIEAKLALFSTILADHFKINSRPFVDSKPVFDRFWAWRAGLGWLGKNTLLINRKLGSYLFLGGLFVDQSLQADVPDIDHCGRCRKCIEACPTNAILEDRFVDSGLCIAYHTIENKGVVPEPVMAKSDRWIAGCDICQHVCPWNDPVTEGKTFSTINRAFDASLQKLITWTQDDYRENMQGIAMNRVKFGAFLRNLAIATANSELDQNEKRDALDSITKTLSILPDSQARDGAQKALSWAYEVMNVKPKA